MFSHSESPVVRECIVGSSPLVQFGCVKLQSCVQRHYEIRNCCASLLLLDCSIATRDNTPSPVFALQTASRIALQPGETATLIIAYSPHAVQEDVALLKLQPEDPALTRHIVCLLGFGGQCHAEVTMKEKVMISNTGDRTACFFLVDGSKSQVSLVRDSNVLPPYFMLPPMMEFGVDPQELYSELQQHKVAALRGAEA